MGAFASSVGALTQQLKKQFDLVPVIGFEVECYLRQENEAFLPNDDAWHDFAERCKARGLTLDALKEEDGEGQYEFCLSPKAPSAALDDFTLLKDTLHAWAEAQGCDVVFVPRVEETQPSSALHIHVHLDDATGENVFQKDEDELSAPLANTIAGLLELLPASMLCFAPDEVSYKRYREWEKYTPSKVAWGNNNRTTPIRMPAPEKPTLYRHVEHRVSAAHADAEAVLTAILAGVLYGLEKTPELPECMYGDARERNYPELADLPKNLEGAIDAYVNDERLVGYLQAEAREEMKRVTSSHTASVA